MAFKQSNNPISRKTSPLRAGTFSMKDLEAKAASEKSESQSQANKLPQIEKPGADYEMDTDMTYAGGERGADYDEEGTKNGMSRIEEAKYFGLGKDDGKKRKENKVKKTNKQIAKLSDGRKKDRKVKKLAKTKQQLL